VSDLAIRCEGIAKQYRIGARESYRSLRDALTDAITTPIRRMGAALHGGNGHRDNSVRTIWALQDVSFEVRTGEVVGIIGRNGAGKSTLLKILSRITKPTRGSAEIYGRVGSLLEVGTGFHPELTGRENVYLNGAILGMKKAEMDRKFDEIVAFAELEEFIDTPVKRYSSGMYTRLAFAVAAYLDPEILLVDEVLAVGDARFQKKCLGKMGQVAKEGRTVLFVSHNLVMLQRLCNTGILLDAGSLALRGSTSDCIRRYREILEDDTQADIVTSSDGGLSIRSLRTFDEQGRPTELWKYGKPLTVEVEIEVKRPQANVAVDITFYSMGQQRLFGFRSDSWATKRKCDVGIHKITFLIKNPGLCVPEMYMDVGLRTSGMAYEALLLYAAYLFVKPEGLPFHSLALDLLTPQADIAWEPVCAIGAASEERCQV